MDTARKASATAGPGSGPITGARQTDARPPCFRHRLALPNRRLCHGHRSGSSYEKRTSRRLASSSISCALQPLKGRAPWATICVTAAVQEQSQPAREAIETMQAPSLNDPMPWPVGWAISRRATGPGAYSCPSTSSCHYFPSLSDAHRACGQPRARRSICARGFTKAANGRPCNPLKRTSR